MASSTAKFSSERLSQIREQRWLWHAALASVLLLATALRVYRLDAWSFWYDELFTVNRALVHVNLETLIAQWWHPSISLILTKGALDLFGASEWSARLAPAAIAIATIPILYFLIARLFDAPAAIISVLLLAISPWHLEWSQNARFYTSLLLLYFLASYFFFQALERDRPLYLLLAGLLFVLAVGERFQAVFLVPVALVYLASLALLPVEKPPGFRFRNLALIGIPGIIFVIIELTRFFTTGTSYVLSAYDLTASFPIDDPFRLAMFIGFNIGLPLLCLAVAAAAYLIVQKSRLGLFVTLSAILPVLILLLLNPFLFTKDRYVFMTLPFWAILAAVAVRELYRHAGGYQRLLAVGVLLALLVSATGDLILYYQINHGNRNDWRAAYALVEERDRPDDRYVAGWPNLGLYYLGQQVEPFTGLRPEELSSRAGRVWFILDAETIWTNARMKAWVEQNAELIDVSYLRRPTESFLRIYLYDPGR